jgi:RNA polymerase sigma-70 factor (ECF subfamily)
MIESAMDDRKTIERCRAGRTEAFGDLVRQYQSQAIGHALTLLGNLPDALDAVQDAFVAAYQALGRFDASRKFYPWFYTILRHRCYKVLTARQRRPVTDIDDVQLLALPADEAWGDETAAVQRVLPELAPEDRELLVLKHLDGLTYKELAQRLGVPAGTVMSRLYHARRRFREKFARMLDDHLTGIDE